MAKANTRDESCELPPEIVESVDDETLSLLNYIIPCISHLANGNKNDADEQMDVNWRPLSPQFISDNYYTFEVSLISYAVNSRKPSIHILYMYSQLT